MMAKVSRPLNMIFFKRHTGTCSCLSEHLPGRENIVCVCHVNMTLSHQIEATTAGKAETADTALLF